MQQRKQWQQICSIEIGIFVLLNEKVGSWREGEERVREREQLQNGSRDISYLIKVDCVYFLIGLKLYDHDYQIEN